MNEVCSSFGGCITIWLYPVYAFMKLSCSGPAVASTNWSIRGRGKLFLGHVLFKSVKSTHVCHLSFGFLTKTTLVTHYGYLDSWINSISSRRSTYSLRALYRSGSMGLLFCLIGFLVGSMFSWWYDLGRNPDHISVFPCKDVLIISEELDNVILLIASELGTNIEDPIGDLSTYRDGDGVLG